MALDAGESIATGALEFRSTYERDEAENRVPQNRM
jgi:hypothetical protein